MRETQSHPRPPIGVRRDSSKRRVFQTDSSGLQSEGRIQGRTVDDLYKKIADFDASTGDRIGVLVTGRDLYCDQMFGNDKSACFDPIFTDANDTEKSN